METFGICLQALIPIRSNPAESAEMVTQLLFGETYTVLQKNENWIEVKITSDQYTGWLDAKLFEAIDYDYINKPKHILKQVFTEITINNIPMLIPAGSEIPVGKNDYTIGLKHIVHKTKPTQEAFNKNQIISLAKYFLNAPYLWGGKNMMGIDCSGLTQICFKTIGIQLPRDASQQIKLGETIGFISESQTGDLAFFDNEEGHITHVGIIISPQQIIHTSGCVRIDNIDHQGIFNSETQSYSHKLRIIKRIESIF